MPQEAGGWNKTGCVLCAQNCVLEVWVENNRITKVRPDKVETAAGSVQIELEVTDSARPGHVAIPHGFGLEYEGRVYGANVNRLTKNPHRDPLAGTPSHRYVPCRVEKIS